MPAERRGDPPASAASQEPTLEGVFSSEGIDVTVIRWMLRKTPTERLEAAQDLIDAVQALRTGDEG